jgi:hypothetical protein
VGTRTVQDPTVIAAQCLSLEGAGFGLVTMLRRLGLFAEPSDETDGQREPTHIPTVSS